MAKVAGWIVAALCLVAALSAYFWGAGHQRRATELEERLAGAARNNAALKQTLDEMGAQIEGTMEEVRLLEERVTGLPAPAASPDTPGDPNMEALQQMMQALQGSSDADETAEHPFAAMFAGERGKTMARMSAQSSLPVLYGGLFRELNLPPEAEARVRELLIDFITEEVSQGLELINADVDPDEIRRNRDARGQKLRNELAAVLTAGELAVFDEFEENKGRRMLESSFDMQLGMFASGLSDENRIMLRDVLVEEMTAEGDWFTQPETFTDPAGAVDLQLAAFHTARDRVAPAMDAEQLAHVDAFVRQMESMLQAQREFAETLMNHRRRE